ncbi:MBL fold metallo-hydrolase [Rubrivirga marina]|uniref:MBL fold metallo-hydrolase n=1 Tax=Rubrivirga marina TaxID=1196024 RepID=A0A271J181_9BACT|nr:MBL fold metallo-hydrolase [Rubrivirga marina]PAP77266.1 MBL fold metallo-hydrolase [Rubrivirga marina]
MWTVDEIAPDVFRISVFAPEIDLQFNHFLVRDDEPLLYHTGLRAMFPAVREAVGSVLDPAGLRWISGSHFEADEWGALNDWLGIAPNAQAVCGVRGTLLNLTDFAARAPRALPADEPLETGRHRFRFLPTPHLPHGWDAGVLFEETGRTLFCSDLFHQTGPVEPITTADVVGRSREALLAYQADPEGILMDYVPYTPNTKRLLHGLAELQPQTLAVMHGSSFDGDGAGALRDLAEVMREVYGGELEAAPPAPA